MIKTILYVIRGIVEYTMNYTPVAVLKPSEETNRLNASLCMLCQTLSSEKLTEKSGKVKYIIKTTIEHDNLQTGKYTDVLRKSKITDQNTLDVISYHKTCYSKFTTDGIALKRKHDKQIKKDSPVASQPRLSRSSVKPFNRQRCLFCQNEGMGELHECMTEARALKLKQAFEDCPASLALYKIRYERALDARAGDIKYHTLCWIEHVDRRIKDFEEACPSVDIPGNKGIDKGEGQGSSSQEDFGCSTNNKKNDTIIALVMYEIIHGVEISLEKSEVLTICDVINVYKEKLNEQGGEDNRVYPSVRKWIKKCLLKHIPDIKFSDSENKLEPQKITTSNLDSLLVHLAVQRANQDNETEIGVLKSAAHTVKTLTGIS